MGGNHTQEIIWDNLRPVQTGSKPPLFWIHNEHVNFVAEYLAPDQPIFTLKHQGRRGERIRLKRVETIAADICRKF